MTSRTAAIVLAAGQGTRMQSKLPKVLHPCAGTPLICHAVRAALGAGCAPVVVVVSPSNQAAIEAAVRHHLPKAELAFAVQARPRGTGDAARAGLEAVPEDVRQVVVTYGDVPLLTAETLGRLREAAHGVALSLLVAEVADPTGYGRVVRDRAGKVTHIVEHKDASESQRAIREVNAGVYWAGAQLLRDAVSQLRDNNAQGELYLTDVVATAARAGGATAVAVRDPAEIRGVNSRAELALVEGLLRARLVAQHQARGVTFLDPNHVTVGLDVTLGRDVTVGPGVQLLGDTQINDEATVEGPSVLIDSRVGQGAVVRAFSHLEGAHLGPGAQAGPYARLRPEARLDANARVGNFVEIKKARLGPGAKVNHLSYVGDATVGEGSNVGAGVIFANYDGFQKRHTHVEAGCFVGSNSTLIAPLTIGAGALVAAGSTISRDVAADAVAFGRARQEEKSGAAPVLRARQGAAAKAAKEAAAKKPGP